MSIIFNINLFSFHSRFNSDYLFYYEKIYFSPKFFFNLRVGKDKINNKENKQNRKIELVSKNELCDKNLSDENIVSRNEKQMKIMSKIEDMEPAYKKGISMLESMNTNKR